MAWCLPGKFEVVSSNPNAKKVIIIVINNRDFSYVEFLKLCFQKRKGDFNSTNMFLLVS